MCHPSPENSHRASFGWQAQSAKPSITCQPARASDHAKGVAPKAAQDFTLRRGTFRNSSFNVDEASRESPKVLLVENQQTATF